MVAPLGKTESSGSRSEVWENVAAYLQHAACPPAAAASARQRCTAPGPTSPSALWTEGDRGRGLPAGCTCSLSFAGQAMLPAADILPGLGGPEKPACPKSIGGKGRLERPSRSERHASPILQSCVALNQDPCCI